MPIGAMLANKAHMDLLQDQPKLGHITTFGGHPVISAAALATLREVFEQDLLSESLRKEALIREELQHPKIKEIRGKGLMLALMMKTSEEVNKVIFSCLDKGLILFWLLYENRAIRMSPPLNISDSEIKQACAVILSALDEL